MSKEITWEELVSWLNVFCEEFNLVHYSGVSKHGNGYFVIQQSIIIELTQDGSIVVEGVVSNLVQKRSYKQMKAVIWGLYENKSIL